MSALSHLTAPPVTSPKWSLGARRRRSGASRPDTARLAGVLFLITFATSIPALLLYAPVLHDHGYITGAGSDGRVLLGAFLELLLVVANIGTAVVLFPVLRRQSESRALGYVMARVVESAFIAVGLLSVLAVVTLRQDLAGGGADASALTTVGRALVAVHDWTFLLGPGFVVGIGNGLLLGSLMYRSGLVPRRMAMLGLVGGPLVCASGVAVLFGAIEPGSAAQGIATVPEILWELSLGVYLTVRGFRTPSSRLGESARPRTAGRSVSPSPVVS